MERTIAGQIEAFEALILRYQSQLGSYLHRFCRRQDDLEDITQEAFIRAYKNLAKWAPEGGSFKSWLMRLATNVAYDYLRDEKRYPWPDPEREAELANQIDLDQRQSPRSYGDTVAFLLSKLEPEDRLLMTLRYSEGYSVQEISNALNWGESKVKVRSLRARKQLESCAEKHGIRIE